MPLFQQTFNPSTPAQSGGLGARIKSALEMFQGGLNTAYAPANAKAGLEYKQAQAKRENAMANLPFGGASVPGPAGDIVGLQMIKNLYGENSPQYKQASDAFGLSQNAKDTTMKYQAALTNSLPLRYTTPAGKAIVEQSNINAGYSPAGTPVGQPVSPGAAPYTPPGTGEAPANPLSDRYDQKRQKDAVPASVLQKNLYASNIEKTLKSIDPDILTRYSGPAGATKLKKEQMLDLFGNSSPEYKEYKDAMTLVDYLAGQVTQFYGESITPEEQARKRRRFDQTGALTSPETAKSIFNASKDLLHKELDTYRNAEKGTSVYQGKNDSKEKPSAREAIKKDAESFNSQLIHMVGPDGKEYDVPTGKAQRFIENGFKRKG